MSNDHKAVFAISEDKSTVIIGITEAAWGFMKDGKTHTFDLRRFGIDTRIILYGGKDQAACRAALNTTPDTLDVSGLDVGFGKEDK